MPDLLSDVRKGLEKRLHELEASVEEHAQIRHALDALKSTGARVHRPARSAAKPATAASSTGRRGRPRGTGHLGKGPAFARPHFDCAAHDLRGVRHAQFGSGRNQPMGRTLPNLG